MSSVTDSCQQGLLESFLRDPCDCCVELSVLQRQRLRGQIVKLNWCVKQRVINTNKNYTSVGGWLSVARIAERLGLCHHASIHTRIYQRTDNGPFERLFRALPLMDKLCVCPVVFCEWCSGIEKGVRSYALLTCP